MILNYTGFSLIPTTSSHTAQWQFSEFEPKPWDFIALEFLEKVTSKIEYCVVNTLLKDCVADDANLLQYSLTLALVICEGVRRGWTIHLWLLLRYLQLYSLITLYFNTNIMLLYHE